MNSTAAPELVGSARVTIRHPDEQWTIAPECDSAWWTRARDWGGGFFHHPNALSLGPHSGTPIVATCADKHGIAAVAVGVRWRCRLSGRLRHAYFPSMPLVRPGVAYAAMTRSLCHALRAQDIDDIVMDSFDAPDASRSVDCGTATADRAEYRVALVADADPVTRLAQHHARLVRRGERERWTLEMSVTESAIAALATVTQAATVRGAERGNVFSAAPWHLMKARALSDAMWGVTICRAIEGETLLSAALVGWGADRAFYLGGGSTTAGYDRGAAAWLHWRILNALRERGATCYNFGGAPAAATLSSHPSHGLHRFKSAFGAQRVPLRSLRWTHDSLHTGLHRAAQRLHLSPSAAQ